MRNLKSLSHALAAGLAVLALGASGCETVDLSAAGVDGETRMIDRYLADAGLSAAEFPATQTAALSPAPSGVGLDIAYAENMGVLSLPAAEHRLNEMLTGMRALIPGETPAARVYIQPGMRVNAMSVESGAIFVNFATFASALRRKPWAIGVGNDDELAFLIAHEYAHILLDHFALNRADKGGFDVVQAVRLATAAQILSLDAEEDYERWSRKQTAAFLLGEAALTRGWSRKYEKEADLLAFDLIIAAGYSPKGIMSVFLRLTNPQNLIIASEILASGDARSLLGRSHRGEAEAGGSGKYLSDSGPMGFDISNSPVGESHPSVEPRQNVLAEYQARHYADVTDPGFRRDEIYSLIRDPLMAEWLSVYDRTVEAMKLAGLYRETFSDGVKEAADLEALDPGGVSTPDFQRTFARARSELRRVAIGDPYLRTKLAVLREAEGKLYSAAANLMLVEKHSGRTPLRTLLELTDRLLAIGDRSAAREAAQKAITFYPDETLWYPQLIAIELLAGQRESAEVALQACRVRATPDIVLLCRERARGQGPGFERRQGGDLIEGLLPKRPSSPPQS